MCWSSVHQVYHPVPNRRDKRTFFDSVVYGGGDCRTSSWAEKEGTTVNIGEKERKKERKKHTSNSLTR